MRVQHHLPERLIKAVDNIIKKGGEFATRSELIRHLLREWVAKEESEMNRASRVSQAFSLNEKASQHNLTLKGGAVVLERFLEGNLHRSKFLNIVKNLEEFPTDLLKKDGEPIREGWYKAPHTNLTLSAVDNTDRKPDSKIKYQFRAEAAVGTYSTDWLTKSELLTLVKYEKIKNLEISLVYAGD